MKTKDLDEQVEKILQTRTVSRAQQLMESRSGIWLVAIVSFIESALPLPIITDPFLIAAILLNRKKTKLIIAVTSVTSVLGGVVAFFSALLFLEILLSFLSADAAQTFTAMTTEYKDSAFLLTLLGAVTPIPYTMAGWAAAVVGGSLWAFIVASIIGRSFRYLVVGYLTYWFGPAAVKHARRSIGITSVILFILAGLYFWLKM